MDEPASDSDSTQSQSQTQTEHKARDEALLQEHTATHDTTDTLDEFVADNDSNNDNNNNNNTDNDSLESTIIIDTDTQHSNSNTQSKNRRWIPKSQYRRLNKSILKQQINLVTNLSNIQLTNGQKSLLNKGLNFCPNPDKVNLTQISADCYHLERNMAWKYIFPPGSNNLDPDYVKSPFDNTKKVNMPSYYPQEISTFAESVRSDLIGAHQNKVARAF